MLLNGSLQLADVGVVLQGDQGGRLRFRNAGGRQGVESALRMRRGSRHKRMMFEGVEVRTISVYGWLLDRSERGPLFRPAGKPWRERIVWGVKIVVSARPVIVRLVGACLAELLKRRRNLRGGTREAGRDLGRPVWIRNPRPAGFRRSKVPGAVRVGVERNLRTGLGVGG